MDVASVVIITKLIMMAWRQCGLDIVSLEMGISIVCREWCYDFEGKWAQKFDDENLIFIGCVEACQIWRCVTDEINILLHDWSFATASSNLVLLLLLLLKIDKMEWQQSDRRQRKATWDVSRLLAVKL